MTSHLDRFEAFYQTASFWNGKLAGVQQFPLSNFDFHHLQESDEELVLPSIPVGTVLGKRAEYFFQFCVEQSSNYNLLLANEQIFRGKDTIGELDYIVQDRVRNKIIHIELVYKFYIYEPTKPYQSTYLSEVQNQALAHYVGPNRRDYFIKKLDHLLSKQLPLLHQPETRVRLEELGITETGMEQQVCFLAHVFIPQAAWREEFKFLNKKCIVGYYLEEPAFAKAETTNVYFIPEKKEWKMSPQVLETSFSHAEVLQHAIISLKRGFAPMIWMHIADGTFERFFIVSPLS